MSTLTESGNNSHAVNHKPVCPLRHLGSQLTEMEKLIDKMMQEDFVRYATADLNRALSEGATAMDEVTKATSRVFTKFVLADLFIVICFIIFCVQFIY